MGLQRLLLWKFSVTSLTIKSYLFMNTSNMLIQITFMSKSCFARFAFQRLFLFVYSLRFNAFMDFLDMLLQILFKWKTFTTLLTLIYYSLNLSNMPLERAFFFKVLAASCTKMFFFLMGQHVWSQTYFWKKYLLTEVTIELCFSFMHIINMSS